MSSDSSTASTTTTTTTILENPHSLSDNIEEWLTLCSVNERFAQLFADKAVRGDLVRSGLRAVLWKWRLLNVAPASASRSTSTSSSTPTSTSAAPLSADAAARLWLSQVRAARTRYHELRLQYLVDPHAAEHASFDPLSNADASPWNEYFENAELEREIEQDVLRTYPEHAYFRQAHVQTLLRRILLVYARAEPHVQYKQGMHELLAPILFLFEQQALTADAAAAVDAATAAAACPSYAPLLDAEHVEADAFAAFHGLMSLVQDWFVQPPRRAPGAPPAPESRNHVVDKCEAIQGRLLRQKDAELAAHLDALRVLPQLYMLRWLRCLFGREFHLVDTLKIWDALFAYDRPLLLVDHMCVAMLRYVRGQLLLADNGSCLQRLKTFPPVENVGFLIELAVKQLRGVPTALDAPPPAAAPTPVAGGADPLGATVVELASAALQTTKSLFAAARSASSAAVSAPEPPTKSSGAAPPASHQPQLQHQQQQQQQQQSSSSSSSFSSALPSTDAPVPSRATMDHMASRIERICLSLHTEMRQNASISQNETLMFALAELKQVRDVLAGRLPA
jgi:hypothetical protein